MTKSDAIPSIPQGPPQAETDRRPTRPTAFNWMHLVVLLVCLFPLNPIVVESFRNPNLRIRISPELLMGVMSMFAGPFAPWLFPDHAEIATSLIVTACAILATGVTIQFVWRPRQTRFEVLRQSLWAITCWLWFASAVVAFAAAM